MTATCRIFGEYVHELQYALVLNNIEYLYSLGDQYCYTVIDGELNGRFTCESFEDIQRQLGITRIFYS